MAKQENNIVMHGTRGMFGGQVVFKRRAGKSFVAASIIGLPLEARYANFTALYPDIVQRVPQRMIASYIGLTPETISRIRRRISAK